MQYAYHTKLIKISWKKANDPFLSNSIGQKENKRNINTTFHFKMLDFCYVCVELHLKKRWKQRKGKYFLGPSENNKWIVNWQVLKWLVLIRVNGLVFPTLVSHQNNTKQLKNLYWRKQEEVGCHQLFTDKILQQMCSSRCHVKRGNVNACESSQKLRWGPGPGGKVFFMSVTISLLALHCVWAHSIFLGKRCF